MTHHLIEKIKRLLKAVESDSQTQEATQDPSYLGLIDLIIELEHFWCGERATPVNEEVNTAI